MDPSMSMPADSSSSSSSSSSAMSSSSTGHAMSMSGGMMVFSTTTIGTPLYSSAWTPTTTAAYAGTCIFLIALAAIFRALIAGKHILERRWLDRARQRRYIHVAGTDCTDMLSEDEQDLEDDDIPRADDAPNTTDDVEAAAVGAGTAEKGGVNAQRRRRRSNRKYGTLIGPRGVEEQIRLISNADNRPVPPWRLSEDVPRAAYTTVLMGVAYLLMLAVMTYNTGYFLSVLGGVFLGELLVGRYAQLEEH